MSEQTPVDIKPIDVISDVINEHFRERVYYGLAIKISSALVREGFIPRKAGDERVHYASMEKSGYVDPYPEGFTLEQARVGFEQSPLKGDKLVRRSVFYGPWEEVDD